MIVDVDAQEFGWWIAIAGAGSWLDSDELCLFVGVFIALATGVDVLV